MASALTQLFFQARRIKPSTCSSHLFTTTTTRLEFPRNSGPKLQINLWNCRIRTILVPQSSNKIVGGDGEDGIVLGTMKIPQNTDLVRFETLLFQWANSLCQGANLPLPVPLKVDKVKGGIRLGFTVIGDGKTETPVYIDCLVFPPEGSDGRSVFRAIRNGPMREQPPPGEPRIMRSLLEALQRSTEIARI